MAPTPITPVPADAGDTPYDGSSEVLHFATREERTTHPAFLRFAQGAFDTEDAHSERGMRASEPVTPSLGRINILR